MDLDRASQGNGVDCAPEIRVDAEMTDDLSETTDTLSANAASEDGARVRHTHPRAAAEPILTGRPSTTSLKPGFNPFSDGAEAAANALGIGRLGDSVPRQANMLAPPAKPKLGNLHKRRASASPEKFNTGSFEPIPLRIEPSTSTIDEPPAKRARFENKVEVSYDSCGTPRIASVTPTIALPSGRTVAASQLLNRYRPLPSKKRFSVLNALYRHNDLLLLLVSYLTIPSLISLYAISKPFHFLFNSHYMAFILSNMRTWAPKADKIYPWRCYQSLCMRDPSLRKKSSMTGKDLKEKHQDLRDVPSLRWLQMVVWRQGVCKDMLIQLATKGLRCPTGTLGAIRRMWFVMDLPLNAHRIALCRSQTYISQHTIFCASMFFLKVDMSFTDPSGPIYPVANQHTNTAAYPRRWERCGWTGCDLREMLTAERNFTSLWRVLRGWSWDSSEPRLSLNRLDVLRLWARHKYRLPENVPKHVKKQSIMGIPWHEVGTAGLERTGVSPVNLNGKVTSIINPGLTTSAQRTHTNQQLLYPHQKRLIVPKEKPREKLLRPEELMLRESVRRQMSMHTQWGRMMLWGFCDDAGRNLPVRTEEELLRWSQGKVPLSMYKSDEEVMKEREAKSKEESG